MVMQTQDYYIAYMDILGYKDYLKQNPESTEKYLHTILDAVEKVKGSVSFFKSSAVSKFKIDCELKLKIFSDNILLCMQIGEREDEIRRAILFTLSVAAIQRGLVLQHSLIVRGGITIGKLFINNDMVFGQGLMDAVDLENKTEYPCISVSDETQKFLSGLLHDVTDQYKKVKEILQKDKRKELLTTEENKYLTENIGQVVKEVYYSNTLRELVRHYDKETAFINYLFDLSFSTLFGYEFEECIVKIAKKEPEKYSGLVETRDDYYATMLNHKKVVMYKVKDNCNFNGVDKTDQIAVSQREKIIRKYVWLLRYHNSICEEHKFRQGMFAHKYGCDMNFLRLIVNVDD